MASYLMNTNILDRIHQKYLTQIYFGENSAFFITKFPKEFNIEDVFHLLDGFSIQPTKEDGTYLVFKEDEATLENSFDAIKVIDNIIKFYEELEEKNKIIQEKIQEIEALAKNSSLSDLRKLKLS